MPALPEILHGCMIFPCLPGRKVPAIEGGWKSASNDPAQIAQWEKDYPGCNWAVATGLSNLFVIDVDPEGLETWKGMLNADEDLRATVANAFTVQTPRGGYHIYFRGHGPSTASRISAGIDTRGGIRTDDGRMASGGYVLLPGSKTGDGIYTYVDGGTLSNLPSVVTQLIPERKSGEVHGLERPPDLDQSRNVQWATDLLKGYAASGRVSVEGKGGNDLAFRVAASILDKAISPGMCYDLLWEHWNPHCQPPWDDWELERVVRNAAAYGEDTGQGAKGFQSNADAFAGFVPEKDIQTPDNEQPRDKLKWLHDYAASVGDPTWLIPGILPARGTGMMFGASGTYKSFLTLDMALCLAYGVPGQWGAPPVKNDVLFLAGEGPIATAKKRWPAWLEWRGIENASDHRIIFKDRVPFYHDTEAWEHVKIDLAEMGAKPSLIVIDTLSRLLTGMDENSTKDATMTVGFMEALAHHYECFVLAVHHTGKDEKKGARGSSVFHANMDTVLATRLRSGGSELRVKKQKDADVPDEPHYFQIREAAESIVLERVEALPEERNMGAARHDWASLEEVTAALHALGGRTSTAHLVQSIAADKGLVAGVVRKRLLANKDLAWLREDSNTWAIPQKDYDL